MHDEYSHYWEMHALYGHVCDAEMKKILKSKAIKGAPVQIHFPPKQLPCATCILAKGIASRTAPTPAVHDTTSYAGEVVRVDNMGPINIKGGVATDDTNRYREINVITDAHTGCVIACTALETKAQTADAQDVTLRQIHRWCATQGGTRRIERDQGTDVGNARTTVFCKEQGIPVSNFAPGDARPRGGVERIHMDIGRHVRVVLIAADIPTEQWYYVLAHARRLTNLTMSSNDPAKSKHEAYYRRQPTFDSLHLFGCQVIIKVFPKPTMFKARAIRGRWYGLAGDSGHSVHLVSVQVVTPGGMLTHRRATSDSWTQHKNRTPTLMLASLLRNPWPPMTQLSRPCTTYKGASTTTANTPTSALSVRQKVCCTCATTAPLATASPTPMPLLCN